MNRKYTKEMLEPIVKDSKSIRQILIKLHLKETGGNYLNIKTKIKKFNIDTSHWVGENGQCWNKGLSKFSDSRIKWGKDKDDIFVKNSTVATTIVKKYLQDEESFIHKCCMCNNHEWLSEPIPLELDHINGDNRDNRKENLRFICPNCHTKTDTYRGRNIHKKMCLIEDKELVDILISSVTIRQALIKANLTPKGGNYARAYKLIHEYNIEHLK